MKLLKLVTKQYRQFEHSNAMNFQFLLPGQNPNQILFFPQNQFTHDFSASLLK